MLPPGFLFFAGRFGSLATKAAYARIELAYPFHQSLQHPTLNPRVECQVQRRYRRCTSSLRPHDDGSLLRWAKAKS
jgi:hypothetical protein